MCAFNEKFSPNSCNTWLLAIFYSVNFSWFGQQLVFEIVPPDHLFLDSAPNLGPLISHWEINKFENCWYKSVRILEVLKLLIQQFLNLSSSQRDISGPILGALSDIRWSGGIHEIISSFSSLYLYSHVCIQMTLDKVKIKTFFVGTLCPGSLPLSVQLTAQTWSFWSQSSVLTSSRPLTSRSWA